MEDGLPGAGSRDPGATVGAAVGTAVGTVDCTAVGAALRPGAAMI